MRWLVVLVFLAGCSAGGPPAEETPLYQGPSAPPPLPPVMELRDCDGPSLALLIDGAAARQRVPEPFEPFYFGGPGGVTLALGFLEQRVCDLGGPVAFSLATVGIAKPAVAGDAAPTYLLAMHVDRPDVVEALRAQGVPARNGTLVDNSVWLVGWTGAVDMAMGGDHVTGAVAGSDFIRIVQESQDVFHREGDVITRWSSNRSSTMGELTQAAALLHPDTWGPPAMANFLTASFHVSQRWDDHKFTQFTLTGEPLNATAPPDRR